MSYNFSFADNGIYGASDINKITSRLVTSGVEDSFTDGVPYNLSTLNEAGALLYTQGVVPETIITLKVVSGSGENTVLINPGTAFFADGSVIEIEDGGHELSFTPGVKNYVYLKNDLITSNISCPECSIDAPSGDYVLLAEIEEDGTIEDKRTYAKGKLPGYQSNQGYPLIIEDVIELDENKCATVSYDVGANNYRYLFAKQQGTSFYDNGFTYYTGAFQSSYDFETGEYLSFYTNNSKNPIINATDLYLYYTSYVYSLAKVTFENGILTLNISCSALGSGINCTTIPITLYLF